MVVRPRDAEHDPVESGVVFETTENLQPEAAGIHGDRTCEIGDRAGDAQVERHKAVRVKVEMFGRRNGARLSVDAPPSCAAAHHPGYDSGAAAGIDFTLASVGVSFFS